jgi:uncharacterized protein YyaL (SSP411 family)
MLLEVFAALYYITGDAKYRALAEQQIGAFAGEAARNSIPLAALLSAIDFYFNGMQIVIRAGDGTDALLEAVHGSCVPNRILTVLAASDDVPKGHPAEGKANIGGAATAYVCVGETCSPPVTDPQQLRSLLSRRSGATTLNVLGE